MITLLIDSKNNFIPDKNYIRIDYSELPTSFDKGVRLQQLIHSKGIFDKEILLAIEGVDKLDAKKSSLLSKFLISKPSTTKVLLIATNENKVSNHIVKISNSVKRIGRTQKEKSFWENLRLNMISRRIPQEDEMYMLLRGIGDSVGVSEDNRTLACKLDELLFETHTQYLTSAWAGLHNLERQKLTFVSTKKKDKVVKKKPKIYPTKMKNHKKKIKKNLEDWL